MNARSGASPAQATDDQVHAGKPSVEPVPDDSENIDLMIQAAQREDQTSLTTEKKQSDTEVQAEQKTAIETPESEGVSF